MTDKTWCGECGRPAIIPPSTKGTTAQCVCGAPLIVSSDRQWPHQVLSREVTKATAKALAKKIISRFGADPEGWLEAGRFHTKDEPVGNYGGLEALCIPMDRNSFRFVIYGSVTDPNPARRVFLICHEVAHTFFYFRKPGTRPHRAHPISVFTGGNEWEEDFCDAFAFAVTGFSHLPLGLNRRKKVPA